MAKKRAVRGWKANGGFELVDNAYLQTENSGKLEEERAMINLLMRWNGGTDNKTIFPGKVPWDQQDGLPLETMKAITHFGAEENPASGIMYHDRSADSCLGPTFVADEREPET